MKELSSYTKRLAIIFLVLMLCIAFEIVLGENKTGSGDFKVQNLYADESMGFHNNRAIIGIEMKNQLFKENFLVVNSSSDRVHISSNLKDCKGKLPGYTVENSTAGVYCINNNHAVIGLQKPGDEINDGSVQFTVYRENARNIIFEKTINMSNN